MANIRDSLKETFKGLSDQNYEESFAFYRIWSDVGYTHTGLQASEEIFDTIWSNRSSDAVAPEQGKLFHPKVHLLLRFAGDAESGCIDPHIPGLQSRLCARALQDFFESSVRSVWDRDRDCSSGYEYWTAVDSNFIAWWANSGHVEQATIRNHILQSLISYPKLYDHQADALIILFKIAGATFEAYTDPSVVDRCFELLKNYYDHNSVKGRLVQVRPPRSRRQASS